MRTLARQIGSQPNGLFWPLPPKPVGTAVVGRVAPSRSPSGREMSSTRTVKVSPCVVRAPLAKASARLPTQASEVLSSPHRVHRERLLRALDVVGQRHGPDRQLGAVRGQGDREDLGARVSVPTPLQMPPPGSGCSGRRNFRRATRRYQAGPGIHTNEGTDGSGVNFPWLTTPRLTVATEFFA